MEDAKPIDGSLSIVEQIEHIKKGKMKISDEKIFENFLRFNGFYRVNKYIKRLKSKQNKDLKLYEIYNKDSLLRITLFKYISIIEIRLRGVLNEYYSNNICDFLKEFDEKIYINEDYYDDFKLKVNQEIAVKKQKKYCNEKFKEKILLYGGKAKFWMILEIISFTQLSKFLNNLNSFHINKMKNEVWKYEKAHIIKSKIRAIVNLRNLCAHHDILFKSKLSVQSKFAHDQILENENLNNPDEVYYAIKDLTYFLDKEDISSLEEEIKQVNLQNYGFPNNWKSFDIK